MATSVSPPIPSLKSRLRKGDCLYGLFFDSFSPTIAQISGHAGYDFIVIDMEHGFGGISEALSCLNALAASQTPAILRLPECSAMWAKKALDLGPQGLMFPMIHTPELAKEAVSYCRYPQAGIRGVAHPITRASKYGLDPTYLDWCEEELLIMCQVESEEAVHKIQEITAVDGLDCIMLGPTDLSANMGYIRDPGNENAVKMVQTVENAVLGMKPKGDKRVYLAGFAMPHDEHSELKKRGYHMVCGAVDIVLYRDAAVKDVLKFKTTV
uniref:HpcH/HpaI aldolase/citrate lyase domain-containing protein n=2 Tax=Chenopodium quinoa TaxID=63459 RepID=A0A803L5A3_CHEQI